MSHGAAWLHFRRCVPGILASTACGRTAAGSAQLTASLLAFTRRRQLLHNSCARSIQRQQSTLSVPSDRPLEARLLAQLDRSQTGAIAQRETVWGLYRRYVKEGDPVHAFTSTTLLRFLELLAGDQDSNQALARIATVLEGVANRRRLTDHEVQSALRICSDVNAGHPTSTSRPPAELSHHSTPILPNIELTTTKACLSLPVSRADSAAATTDTKHGSKSRPNYTSPAIEKLRLELASPQIEVDPAKVQTLYRSAIAAGLANERDRLTTDDLESLCFYCPSLGKIAGQRFLAQLEADAAADPLLCPQRHKMLITAYAKLGLLDDSRRLYQEALRSGVYECMDHIEWSMCLALFRSSRHREARAIFDKLAHANRATPGMYDLLAREYVLLQNKERAFALLDDMRRLDMRPTRSCFNVLATACSLDRDGDRGSARLSELIVCMASWGWAPDKEFFLNLLKGYHWSNQHSMFDGLIRRLRAHGLGSDPMLCKIALVNAVARQDLDLVASMAPLAARAPGNIAKVVQVLAQLGLASDLPACANLAQYPDNNIMARIRLDIAQNSPVLIACPQSLVDALECMVEGGFTPSFRQFHHAIHRIYLQGGPMLAIQTYKRLAAAGAPASINLQFLVLQMHVELGDSEAALTVFDELRNQLKDTEFTTLRFHPKPLKALVRLLMEKHGVTAAQQAFDFLTTLPISRRHLPYSLMIEYYLGHRMVDDSRSLISHAVQHDIPLQPRIIDSYCRHLELHSSTTDLANFLRYVQRTRFLSLVADDVLETFFALCALEHKISDLEWITEQLVLMRGRANAWTAIIDRLAVVDIHILSFIVHFAIEKSWRRQDMAVLLLECSMRSPCRAKLAEVVLAGLEAQNMQPGRRVYQMAIAAFAHSWMKHYSRLGNPADPFASREFLINALRQYVPWAVEVGISPSLITNSLLALSSASRFAYKECLDLLLDMRPELLDGRFYCAIATSCARRGMAVEIDKVLEAMQRQGVLPTSNVLVSLMHCYANVRPPPVRPDYSLSGSEPLSNALVPASSHDDQPHCQPPSLGHSRFYAWNLERVLSVWERFKHHGLPVSAAAYAVLARAHIKAGQYEAIELVFADMLRQGICHSEDTALMWIQGRLMQNDVRGALLVFAAIGSSSRCAELARTDSCYESLDLVRRSSRHFGAVIEHYVRTSELAHAVAIMSAMHQEGLEAGAGLYAMLLGRLVQADSRELFVNVLRQLSKAGVKMDEQLMPIIRDYVAHIKGQRPAVGVADKSDVGADIDSSSSDNDGSGRLPPS